MLWGTSCGLSSQERYDVNNFFDTESSEWGMLALLCCCLK